MGMLLIGRRCQLLHDRARGVASGPEPERLERPTRRDRTKARVTQGGRRMLGRATRARSDEELVRLFGSAPAQKAMFTAMARAFQPSRALGFEGDILYELRLPSIDADPLPPDWWTIEVRGRRARARRQRAEDPTVTLVVELPDLVRLSGGELDPVDALLDGLIEVRGDILIAARLGEMFGAIPDLVLPGSGAAG
jgi:hypothetical protein